MALTTEQIATVCQDRNATIAALRAELKRRTGTTWSVTGGSGTAWGWITVNAPPKRRLDFGRLADTDRAALASALSLDSVHCQGVSIPASWEYRREYLERAAGLPVTTIAQPYWD
jgi:hypothetical protein